MKGRWGRACPPSQQARGNSGGNRTCASHLIEIGSSSMDLHIPPIWEEGAPGTNGQGESHDADFL